MCRLGWKLKEPSITQFYAILNELEKWTRNRVAHCTNFISWSSLWACLLALGASLTLTMVSQNIHIHIVQGNPFMRSTKHGLDLVGDQRFIIPAVTNVRVKCCRLGLASAVRRERCREVRMQIVRNGGWLHYRFLS